MRYRWMMVIGFFLVHVSIAASPLSLDLDEVDMQEALYRVGQFLNVNLVVNSHIKGTISLHVSHMQPEDILNLLLTSYQLTKRVIGHTWIIEPQAVLVHRQQERLDYQKITQALAPLVMRVWRLQYARAESIAHVLDDPNHRLLSRRGKVRADLRTNSLCIQETADHLVQLHAVVHQLDVPIQQVLIEARLASVDMDFERQLGLHFESTLNKNDKEHEIDMSASEGPQLSMAIVKLADGAFLDVRLSALEAEGHGELISSPSLLTENQRTAFIESGEEIPYQETSRNGATSIAFKKAVLSLKVTPQLMPNQSILLQLQVNQDKPSKRVILGVPAISTRQISTNVLVKNGQTIVLGGIYETMQEEGEESIPYLGKIPVIGILFQHKSQNKNKRELLIFVTPRIVKQAVNSHA